MDLYNATKEKHCVQVESLNDLPPGVGFVILERTMVTSYTGYENTHGAGSQEPFWRVYAFQKSEQAMWKAVMQSHFETLHSSSRPRYSDPKQLIALKVEGRLIPQMTMTLNMTTPEGEKL